MADSAQSKIKKILFYIHSPRAFRTTLIGYLYEVCQVYPTILLSEKLDFETEKALSDKELFPKLERIIPVFQITGEKSKNIFTKNRYICNLTRMVVKEERPDIVISGSDMGSMFEMYLMRFSKKIKAVNIAIQPSNVADSEVTEKLVDLINSHLRFSSFLPFWLRLFLTKCRKYLGHFFYYWILPIVVREKPFFGKSSYILRKGNSGMRDADYQIVFSKRDYDINIKNGVPVKKLYILSHPLARDDVRKLFEEIYFNKLKIDKNNEKIIFLLLPTEMEFGFKRNDCSLILKEEREKDWIDTAKLIVKILSDWKIYIKPHPDSKDVSKIREKIEFISENIKFTDPKEPADIYIEMADIIIGLPLSSSAVLFTASLQCPEKPIISLDFYQEILGDYHKDFEGIEYVDNKEQFVKILELIKDNNYKKNNKIKLEEGIFPNFLNLLEYLLKNRKIPSEHAK